MPTGYSSIEDWLVRHPTVNLSDRLTVTDNYVGMYCAADTSSETLAHYLRWLVPQLQEINYHYRLEWGCDLFSSFDVKVVCD
jgi:hypothetical protein